MMVLSLFGIVQSVCLSLSRRRRCGDTGEEINTLKTVLKKRVLLNLSLIHSLKSIYLFLLFL